MMTGVTKKLLLGGLLALVVAAPSYGKAATLKSAAKSHRATAPCPPVRTRSSNTVETVDDFLSAYDEDPVSAQAPRPALPCAGGPAYGNGPFATAGGHLPGLTLDGYLRGQGEQRRDLSGQDLRAQRDEGARSSRTGLPCSRYRARIPSPPPSRRSKSRIPRELQQAGRGPAQPAPGRRHYARTYRVCRVPKNTSSARRSRTPPSSTCRLLPRDRTSSRCGCPTTAARPTRPRSRASLLLLGTGAALLGFAGRRRQS